MGSVVTFDESTHQYRVDGTRYPSVTQVLRAAGLIDASWYTDAACTRGKYVAQATEMLDQGELDEETLDPELRPYLDAWEKFLADSRAEVIAIEMQVYSPLYRYAGTLDRLLLWDGRDTIVDIKTGGAEAWHPIQTAGYARCFKAPVQRACVYLSDDGKYKAVHHTDPNDDTVWLSAVTLAHWKHNNGVKI